MTTIAGFQPTFSARRSGNSSDKRGRRPQRSKALRDIADSPRLMSRFLTPLIFASMLSANQGQPATSPADTSPPSATESQPTGRIPLLVIA